MSNIIDRKANVLVKSGGVTGLSTVCVFQKFDGSFHGSDVRKYNFQMLNFIEYFFQLTWFKPTYTSFLGL